MGVLQVGSGYSDETAYPYDNGQHGRFTFYLLEKLQKSNGNVTLYELGEYIIQKVKAKAAEERTPQTPCVTASPTVGDAWKTWRLK